MPSESSTNPQVSAAAAAEPMTDKTQGVSRRGFGRGVLLGASSAAAAMVVGRPVAALAAPPTDNWHLGGNAGVTESNFIGPTNAVPLIFKTNALGAGPVEAMRIAVHGNFGVGTKAPAARVHALTDKGIAVRGDVNTSAAGARGVLGQITAASPGGSTVGVEGLIRGTTSQGIGVSGGHNGSGIGVLGHSATGKGLVGTGDWGLSASGQSYGTVSYGNVAGSTGLYTAANRYGIRAFASDKGSTGILTVAPNSGSDLNAIGVDSTGTTAVHGTGAYMGVVGTSPSYGVFGYTSPDTGGMGVYGRGSYGVMGRSYTGYAVYGDTDSGTGVRGESYGDGVSVAAVHGVGLGADNSGVIGEANGGTQAYGVWGVSSTGWAGVFSGDVAVTGTLAKGAGSFKIDHPLDPTNKYLSHSFVESPDMMNVYNGNVITDSTGSATVTLPSYFEALNRDFRYQLTVIGQFAQAIVAAKVSGNSFKIKTDKPSVEVSWQVTGIRQDAYANANRIPNETDKPASERGLYLHAAAFGKPASLDVSQVRLAAVKAKSAVRHADPVPVARQSAPAAPTPPTV